MMQPIADCGLWIADVNTPNPKSEIRNPKFRVYGGY